MIIRLALMICTFNLQDMAMLSSATACAPITAHNASGSVNNLAAFGESGSTTSPAGAAACPASCSTSASGGVLHTITTSLSEQSRPLQGLAERFHGLTERLGSLSGLGSAGRSTESDAPNRTRTGKFLFFLMFFLKYFHCILQILHVKVE